MSKMWGRRTALIIAATCLMALPAIGQDAKKDEGNWFTNLLRYGGTTVPPAMPEETYDDIYCPSVGVIEGAAALMAYTGGKTGDPSSLRHQIALGNVARECNGQKDGSILVKVGVQGRALLGPAGTAGKFETPVTFVVKRGDKILVARTHRVTVNVPAGDTQANFTVVETGLVVPPNVGEYEIDVGLSAGPGHQDKAVRRAKRG